VYVSKISVNGESYSRNYFTNGQLQGGGVVNFQMSPTPNKNRGINVIDFPYSLSQENNNK
jgi:putative alpha-1,2-mannosidase